MKQTYSPRWKALVIGGIFILTAGVLALALWIFPGELSDEEMATATELGEHLANACLADLPQVFADVTTRRRQPFGWSKRMVVVVMGTVNSQEDLRELRAEIDQHVISSPELAFASGSLRDLAFSLRNPSKIEARFQVTVAAKGSRGAASGRKSAPTPTE